MDVDELKRIAKEAAEKAKNCNRNSFCTHFPKYLPADEYFRPLPTTLDQWKASWIETRNGLNDEDLAYNMTNNGEHVDMKGVHLRGYSAWSFTRSWWRCLERRISGRVSGKTYKTPELRASRNNALDQLFDVFHIVIGTSFNVETHAFFQSNLDGVKGASTFPSTGCALR